MRAAQAVAAALSSVSSGIEVRVHDLLDLGSPLYRYFYRSAYLALARRLPRFLDWLYRLSDSMPFALAGVLPRLDRLAFGSFLRLVQSDPPDLVLCTHFLPLEILAPLRLSGALSAPLLGVVTDLYPHGIWLWPGVDRYFTADVDGSERIGARVPDAAISPFGIPVHPAFSGAGERKRLFGKLDLPERRTVLLLSGGEGIEDLPALLGSFSGFRGELNLVAIAGKNASLREACQNFASRHASSRLLVRALGFVENMADWMAVSDIVVTKPGGLTLFEALALGRPLLLLPARGGQETINRRWALSLGVAEGCSAPCQAGSTVSILFSNPDRLRRMEENASRCGRPEAARMIAREIVQSLLSANTPKRRLT